MRGAIRAVQYGLRILLAPQDTPGAPIRANETRWLLPYPARPMPVASILEVLTAVGMLEDDRLPAILAWFQRQIARLPAQMMRLPGCARPAWQPPTPGSCGAGLVLVEGQTPGRQPHLKLRLMTSVRLCRGLSGWPC
jgi:hypothetical protein